MRRTLIFLVVLGLALPASATPKPDASSGAPEGSLERVAPPDLFRKSHSLKKVQRAVVVLRDQGGEAMHI